VATVSQGSTQERFGFIKAHGAALGIRYLCEWLGVTPAGYYAWLKRRESKRCCEDRLLLTRIKRIFKDSRGTYGSPRIHAALKREGVGVGRKRVERLMRENGLVAHVARVYRRNKLPYRHYMRTGNLRLSAPSPSRLNQQWVGDLTYVRINHKWHYLAVVMDVYSRRIIGWDVGRYKNAVLTLSSIGHALGSREIEPGLIFHTDRGSEYGAYLVQDELKRLRIRASMNRPESITDNAHAESFFKTIKSEWLHGKKFFSIEELRQSVSQYIDGFYNTVRLHSSLEYRSPIEFEEAVA